MNKLGLPMILVGIIILISGIIIFYTKRGEYDQTVTASVSDKICTSAGPSSAGPSSAGPSSMCVSRYTFIVDGKNYWGTADTNIEGAEVKIKYNSNDPSLNMIGDLSKNKTDVILIYTGIGIIILGMLLISFQSILKRRMARIPNKKNIVNIQK